MNTESLATAAALVTELITQGVQLLPNGDHLKWRAPKGALPETTRVELGRLKPELLALLAPPHPWLKPYGRLLQAAHQGDLPPGPAILEDGTLLADPTAWLLQRAAEVSTIAAASLGSPMPELDRQRLLRIFKAIECLNALWQEDGWYWLATRLDSEMAAYWIDWHRGKGGTGEDRYRPQ